MYTAQFSDKDTRNLLYRYVKLLFSLASNTFPCVVIVQPQKSNLPHLKKEDCTPNASSSGHATQTTYKNQDKEKTDLLMSSLYQMIVQQQISKIFFLSKHNQIAQPNFLQDMIYKIGSIKKGDIVFSLATNTSRWDRHQELKKKKMHRFSICGGRNRKKQKDIC